MKRLPIIALLFLTTTAAAATELRLWYAAPAQKWEEALPVGSGRLGAMVFGGTGEERIQFNEDTLWTGKPHDYVREGSGEVLGEIRKAAFEGRDVGDLIRKRFLSDPVRQKAYQPFGDLRFTFAGHGDAKPADYRRELDLDTAIATTRYKVGDVTHTREVLASHPDNAIVVRLSADKPGKLSFELRQDSPHKNHATKAIGKETIQLTGHVIDPKANNEAGLRFESRARVVAQGGSVTTREDGTIKVDGADAATVLLVAATNFVNWQDVSGDPAKRCEDHLAKIADKAYDAKKSAHVADHQKLFRRVTLDLGETAEAKKPTDVRLKAVRAAKGEVAKSKPLPSSPVGLDLDPSFAALYFQYGRYMLIASSRPGTMPANLQGVWNELLDPPWESKYTTNINYEMNYWPALATNLAELHEPMFDSIDDLRLSGARTAKKMYDARGWVLHHNTDHWRGTAPINNVDGVWPTGGAWLCHHLWDHFLYTGDKEFLAKRAYPAMKEASLFFVDFLIKDPKTGYLVTNPSHSPEQPPPDDRALNHPSPTMDNQLVRSLLSYTIEAAGILGTDADFAAELEAIRKQLPPNMVGKHGQLQEWLEDWDQPNNAHRHMSPLWGLYPGWDITPADKKVFDAAKVLLAWRGDGSTGWSYAWRIPLWARVHDGQFAYRQLALQLADRTLPNLFDLCGPFQVDGNFGATGGVAEMLVQSHIRPDAKGQPNLYEVHLIPALPKAWAKQGSVTGLRARGGHELDFSWEDGKVTKVTLRSRIGSPLKLRIGEKVTDVKTEAGKTYAFDGELAAAANQ
jgi:alpha-L-fucosidase 2